MSENDILRQKVREAIEAGRLPNRNPQRTWGGRGCGACCAICGERIKLDEVEFELEFAPVNGLGLNGADGSGHGAYGNGSNGNGSNGHRTDSLHVHLRCFSAWDCERQESELRQAVMTATGLSANNGLGTIAAREREPEYKGRSG